VRAPGGGVREVAVVREGGRMSHTGGRGKEGGGAAPPSAAAPLLGRETICGSRLLVGTGRANG